MYGLVNQAIEDLVQERFGRHRWESIRARAKTDVASFVSMKSYPDEVTYNLVAAASVELGVPVAELLEAFGEYWTLYTARKGYGELLTLGGSTFLEFLQNLDALHGHVAATFPELRPPIFWCSDITGGSVRLHYRSDRPGLAPMVIGLVRGLGKMFNTAVTIAQVASRSDGADHDEFQITYVPPA